MSANDTRHRNPDRARQPGADAPNFSPPVACDERYVSVPTVDPGVCGALNLFEELP
jgi:hypothetical protein